MARRPALPRPRNRGAYSGVIARFGDRFTAAPRWVLVLVLTALIVYPVAYLLWQPLQDASPLWHQALTIPRIGRIFANTVLLGLGSMVLAIVVALVLAWCRAHLTGRLGGISQLIALLPLVIPPIAGVTGWAFLLSPQVGYLNALLRKTHLFGADEGPLNVYSLPWIIIITGIYLIPYAYVFIESGLRNIDPRVEDAARSAGSSWFGAQLRVILPLLRPVLVYGAGVVLLLALGQFTAPLLLGRTQGIDVITTELYRQTSTPPTNYPLASLLAVPILVLSLIGVSSQRLLLKGGHRFIMSAKGVGRQRQHSAIAFIPIALYALVLVVPPLAALGLVALSPYWSGTPQWSRMGLSAFRNVLGDPFAHAAIIHSIEYACIATVIGVALSVSAAVVVGRRGGIAGRVVDYISNLPIAIPAILFGMGIFLTLGLGSFSRFLVNSFGVSLYGSQWLLVIAYVIVTLPHGTRLAMGGISQIDSRLDDAARVCGSRRLGATMRILLPLLRANVLSAAMLMFVLASHEFAASALLVSPNTQVMSTLLYDRWTTGTYPQVAVVALLMVAVAVIGLAAITSIELFMSRRGKPSLSKTSLVEEP